MLFGGVRVFGQTSPSKKIDSLLGVMSKTTNDTARLNVLYKICIAYPDFDPNIGTERCLELIHTSRILQWREGEAKGYYAKALNERSKNDLQAIIKNADTCLEIAFDFDYSSIKAAAYLLKATVYFDFNNYPDALQNLIYAYDIEQKLPPSEDLSKTLEYMGHVYLFQKSHNKALRYYEESFEVAKKLKEPKAVGKYLMNVGQVYFSQKKFEESIKCFDSALSIFTRLGDDGGIGISLGTLGMLEGELHHFVKAIEYEQKAIELFKKHYDQWNITSTRGNLAKIYLDIARNCDKDPLPDSLKNKAKNLDIAISELLAAEKTCRELSLVDGLLSLNGYASDAFALKGDYKNAWEYFRRYSEIKDSIFSEENNVKIAAIEISKVLNDKENEIKLKKLELQKKRNESIYFGIGILLLLVISLILLRNYRTQKKLNEQIKRLVNEQEKTILERTEELRNSNKKLLQLIQFNVHNLREPITRILGLFYVRETMPPEEFEKTCLPMIEQSVNTLDETLKKVVKESDLNG